MDSEYIVRKYYRRLFLLPKTYVILTTYLLITTSVAVVEVVPSKDVLTYFENILNYLKGATTFLILNLVMMKSKTLNVKRVLGLTTVLTATFSVAEVVFTKLLGVKGLGILASSGLSYIVLPAFLTYIRALTASIIPQLITYLVLNNVSVVDVIPYITNAVVVQTLTLTAALVTLTAIEFKGRSTLGIKPLSLMNAFIGSWFSNDPKPIEYEFMKYSESKEVLLRFVMFKPSNGDDILLVFPTIHFGPFRNIGSSRFIYRLEDALGNRYHLLIFHTPGSHERNLVSSEDVEELVKYVNNYVDGLVNIVVGVKPCKPYVVRTDGWEAYVIPFQTGLITFVKNLDRGCDDLPYEVWELLNSSNTYVNALVDTHSSKGSNDYDLNVFKGLTSEVLNNYRCDDVVDFQVGYSEGYLSSMCRGVCYGKVKALVMSFNNSKHVLIYIYGNNMDLNFRKLLTSEVSKLGFDYVEVVTPDDHSCAASFKESPYDIVSYSEDLLNVVKDVVVSATNNLSSATIHTADIVVKNVKLFGNKVWDMVRGLDILGRLVIKYLPITILTMNLTPLTTLLI
jgi:putative membrane protein